MGAGSDSASIARSSIPRRRGATRRSYSNASTAQARDTVRLLFESLTADYGRMPDEHAANAMKRAAAGDEAGAARVVADYIAGMTDRFALQTRDSLRADR